MINTNSISITNNMPKGYAWEGENLTLYLSFFDNVIENVYNIPYIEFKNELSIDTASPDLLEIWFREINSRNLFPQALTTEDYKRIVKVFRLKRRWITRTDIIDLMARIEYEVQFIDPQDVFDNPDLYPELTYKPKTQEEVYFIIYYKLIPIAETSNQVLPLPFPLNFQGEKRSIAGRLMEEIVDAHIMLYQYESAGPPQPVLTPIEVNNGFGVDEILLWDSSNKIEGKI